MKLHVAVCIATLERPDALQRTLQSVLNQEPSPLIESVTVVVVENDDSGSARSVCEDAGRGSSTKVVYETESRRGVAHARNRLALIAKPLADVIIFTDDDAVPAADWLAQIVKAHVENGADLVRGRISAAYEVAPPDWASAGEFFERPRMKTGTELETASTGNLLVHRKVFDGTDEPFPLVFNLSGGEDTYFTMAARAAGFKIIYCDEAEVTEVYPESRLNKKWLIQRAFRQGNSYGRAEFLIDKSLSVRVRRATRGVGHAVVGIAGLVSTAEVGRLKAVQRVARGLGMITSSAGLGYDEYQTLHGA